MMDILLAALVVELRDAGGEELCAKAMYPGDSIAIDYAECGGMAWVRLVETNPTTGFPTAGFPGAASASKACWWNLVHTVEMGVLRPSPIPEETLNTVDLPGDEEHIAAARKQYADMEAMNRAIIAAKRDIEELVPVNYTPVGPVGGAVGGTWALQVGDG